PLRSKGDSHFLDGLAAGPHMTQPAHATRTPHMTPASNHKVPGTNHKVPGTYCAQNGTAIFRMVSPLARTRLNQLTPRSLPSRPILQSLGAWHPITRCLAPT